MIDVLPPDLRPTVSTGADKIKQLREYLNNALQSIQVHTMLASQEKDWARSYYDQLQKALADEGKQINAANDFPYYPEAEKELKHK